MSITAVSQPSNIWASATSALAGTPTAHSVNQPATGPRPTRADPSSPNPFQQFSSALQSTLLHAQGDRSTGSQG